MRKISLKLLKYQILYRKNKNCVDSELNLNHHEKKQNEKI